MSECADINVQNAADMPVATAASVIRRNIALYSMTLLLSASTIFCVVRSMTLPADINEELMRTENARIDKQLEKSLADQNNAILIPLQSPATHKKSSVAASKQKHSKTAVAAVKTETQLVSSVCEQDELIKLQANFRGGQWDE